MLKALLLQLISVVVYVAFLVIGIKRKVPFKKQIVFFLFYFYIVGVVSVTMFPLPIHSIDIEFLKTTRYLKNNFVPLKSIGGMIKDGNTHTVIRQIIGNIILFIPMGALLPMNFKSLFSFKRVALVGFLASVAIELLQFLISFIIGATYKITDVDDILLNFVGCIVGYLLFRLSIPILKKSVTKTTF
ncbi:MAG: VanZ family protein [Clostridia bacterium]|nr:VanZ family protein [Clostridia bacterium]